MGRNGKKQLTQDSRVKTPRLDGLDLKIIGSLISGQDNKQISGSLDVPLSTVQRRVRRIFASGIVNTKIEPNYSLLGLSKGLLHVYVNGYDAIQVAKEIAKISGVTEVSLHIGNSDVVGEIIYKDGMDIMRAMSSAKTIEGVERVVWSEEVFTVPHAKDNTHLMSDLITKYKAV